MLHWKLEKKRKCHQRRFPENGRHLTSSCEVQSFDHRSMLENSEMSHVETKCGERCASSQSRPPGRAKMGSARACNYPQQQVIGRGEAKGSLMYMMAKWYSMRFLNFVEDCKSVSMILLPRDGKIASKFHSAILLCRWLCDSIDQLMKNAPHVPTKSGAFRLRHLNFCPWLILRAQICKPLLHVIALSLWHFGLCL